MDYSDHAYNVNIVVPEDERAAEVRAAITLAAVEQLQVESSQDYEFAAAELKRIKQKADALEAKRKELTRPLDDTKKQLMDFFKPPLAKLAEAENVLKRCMRQYLDKQEALRLEEQRKLEEKAEKERARLAKQAEKAAAKGDQDKAEEIATKAAMVAAPVVAATAPSVSGVSSRTKYSCDVIDIVALCRAVVDGKVAPVAVTANMTFLRKQAEALQEHFNIPGCALKTEKVIAASRRG